MISGGARFPIAYAIRRVFRNGYKLADLRADVLAGLVVGVVALPLSMALAIAVGAPPQHGLYTAIEAMVRRHKTVILAGPLPRPRAIFEKARLTAKGDSVRFADNIDAALALAGTLVKGGDGQAT